MCICIIMEILYLKNNQIDRNKWDETITTSPQGRVYGYSWYLDCMSPGWDALVTDDYSAVFPLPWTETIPGIKRVFQPRVCQQLGLFLKEGEVSEGQLHGFMKKIPAHFRSVDLQLNECNPEPTLTGWKVFQKTNMSLRLSDDYKTIESRFSDNHKRNIKKSKGADIMALDQITPEEFTEHFLDTFKGKIRDYSQMQKNGLIALMKIAIHKEAGFFRVLGSRSGNILSAAFLLKSHNRIYYVLPFSTKQGRETGAMYKLIDVIIWENSGKPVIFDFEGSSIEGIARFNLGFGAETQHYYQISKENLPWWVKLLIRVKRWF